MCLVSPKKGITDLLLKSPNIQKLTYQLLQQRQNRYLERSTRSMKIKCETEQITTGDDLLPFYCYDDSLLSPPPEKERFYYQTPALITNLYNYKHDLILHASHLDHTFSNNNTEKTLKHHIASNQHSLLTRTTSKILAYCKMFFDSIFNPASSRLRKNTDTISFYCPAKSEFTAAGKLHYILSEVKKKKKSIKF